MSIERALHVARSLLTGRRPPRIGLLAAGDESTASSRMRVHAIRRALAEQMVPTFLSYTRGLDVLILQKKLTERHLEIAKEARADGCLIVYDIDDLGEALWYWTTRPLLERTLDMADLVLTATPEQRDEVIRQFRARRVAVIPCPIDYFPASLPSVDVRDEAPLRVLWFGNFSNFGLIQPYLAPLTGLPDVKPVVVTNAECVDFLSQQYSSIECVAWSLDSFVTVLRGTDVVLLTHDGSIEDRAKSNTKMVTSIAWGVPAVVSRTPDYERTAREFGIEEALFDGIGDFASAIERLRPAQARQAYLARAQPRAWRRYAAAAVARELLHVLQSASGGRWLL